MGAVIVPGWMGFNTSGCRHATRVLYDRAVHAPEERAFARMGRGATFAVRPVADEGGTGAGTARQARLVPAGSHAAHRLGRARRSRASAAQITRGIAGELKRDR